MQGEPRNLPVRLWCDTMKHGIAAIMWSKGNDIIVTQLYFA